MKEILTYLVLAIILLFFGYLYDPILILTAGLSCIFSWLFFSAIVFDSFHVWPNISKYDVAPGVIVILTLVLIVLGYIVFILQSPPKIWVPPVALLSLGLLIISIKFIVRLLMKRDINIK